MPRGGQNLKSKAIQAIRRDMQFHTCVTGAYGATMSIEDWCHNANTLLCIRILGTPYLRLAAKQLAIARTIWKKKSDQDALNAVAALLIKAEQRCIDRAYRRAEKRSLLDVLAQKRKAAEPKPEPAEVEAPEPTTAPVSKAAEIVSGWEQILADQEKKNDSNTNT